MANDGIRRPIHDSNPRENGFQCVLGAVEVNGYVKCARKQAKENKSPLELHLLFLTDVHVLKPAGFSALCLCQVILFPSSFDTSQQFTHYQSPWRFATN